MAWYLTITLVSILFMINSVTGFVTQGERSSGSDEVRINLGFIHRKCKSNRPAISGFTFNVWKGVETPSGCYFSESYRNHPELFNAIVTELRSCKENCSTKLFHSPVVICDDVEVLPNSVAITFTCNRAYQDLLPISTTTSTTIRTTTTTRRTTTIPRPTTTTQIRSTTTSPRTTPTTTTTIATRPPAETGSTTSSPITISVVTTTEAATTAGRSKHVIVARNSLGRPGYLLFDNTPLECDVNNIKVQEAAAYVNLDLCERTRVSLSQIEDSLKSGRRIISRLFCTIEPRVEVQRLVVYYTCQVPVTTMPPGGELTGNDNLDENIILILAVVIPVSIVLVLIPILVLVLYKRKQKGKTALLSEGNVQYSAEDDDVYHDPIYNITTTLPRPEDPRAVSGTCDAVYQDPTALNRPQASGLHPDYGTLYEDPLKYATGPPGTPSPIRDALYSQSEPIEEMENSHYHSMEGVYEDPNALKQANLYAEPDARIPPEGMDSVVVKRDQQRPTPAPRKGTAAPAPPPKPKSGAGSNLQAPNRFSQPEYTAFVKEQQREAHNYAVIRKSKAPTETLYYDLVNDVEFYDSPVYSSQEDLSKPTSKKK